MHQTRLSIQQRTFLPPALNLDLNRHPSRDLHLTISPQPNGHTRAHPILAGIGESVQIKRLGAQLLYILPFGEVRRKFKLVESLGKGVTCAGTELQPYTDNWPWMENRFRYLWDFWPAKMTNFDYFQLSTSQCQYLSRHLTGFGCSVLETLNLNNLIDYIWIWQKSTYKGR